MAKSLTDQDVSAAIARAKTAIQSDLADFYQTGQSDGPALESGVLHSCKHVLEALSKAEAAVQSLASVSDNASRTNELPKDPP